MASENENQREQREAAELAAHLANRDQNDADLQEIARQVGVFCRGLDEAGVVHKFWPYYQHNQDRADAIQFFVVVEMGRLRDRQDRDED